MRIYVYLYEKNVHVIDASAVLVHVYLYMSVLSLWRSSEIYIVTGYLLKLKFRAKFNVSDISAGY